MKNEISAVVTPPINKAGLKKAGFNIPGHTEYLAKLSGTKRFEMMLVGGKLRVVLVTRHMAIQDVPKHVTQKRVEETILLTAKELKRTFGIDKPRLVVCGLNPHAGEEGNFGSEEIKIISPGSTSRTNFAPTRSKAQVSEARHHAPPSLPKHSGLKPKGSLAPIRRVLSIITKEYAPLILFRA